MELSETIRELRKSRGLSQEELADRLGLSRQTSYKWEAGQATPDLDNLRQLAACLGVSAAYLLGEQPAPGPSRRPDMLRESGRMLKKHWRKSGYLIMAYAAGFLGVGLVGRFMVSGFMRGLPQMMRPGGMGAMGMAANPVMILTGFVIAVGAAGLAAGLALVLWDWRVNRKK